MKRREIDPLIWGSRRCWYSLALLARNDSLSQLVITAAALEAHGHAAGEWRREAAS